MKQKLSDMIVCGILKRGILWETRGEFKTECNIPMGSENGGEKNITITITCTDPKIRISEEKNGESN